MKTFRTIIILLATLVGFSSCDSFLEMPEVTGNVYKEDVFSNRKNAEGVLFVAYHRALREGLPEGWGINHGTIASLSAEIARGYSWHQGYTVITGGPHTGSQGCPANFNDAWYVIRMCWNVIQNIDQVTDMSDRMKELMKGEAYGLIAYRYLGMFYRWGGVPIVRQANEMSDDLNFPRATVAETRDFALEMMDEALSRLPDTWVDIEPGDGEKWVGRLTKGAVLAMKARLLTFAARPLFNSATPYPKEFNIDYPEDQMEFVWLGGYDQKRYQDAIDANLAVIEWGKRNGKHLIFTAGEGHVNTFEDAVDDYGRGVSQLNGPETILSFKIASNQTTYNNMNEGYNYSNYVHVGEKAQRGVLTNILRVYRDRDGNDIDWPVVGEPEPRPISNFAENIDKIEARFRVDICVPGKFSLANPGDANWNESMPYLASFTTNAGTAASMARAQEGRGVGSPTKFYYKAGARNWFEFPLFRVAENYLALAEAYNEIGNTTESLRYLNIIRNRAGLPSINVTDKQKLRDEIMRENALEFFEENHRYYDVKHWKRADIGSILGGPMTEISFLRVGRTQTMDALISYWDAYSYTAYWHPKWFLEPIFQSEVNKGIIAQNPGY